MWPTIRPRLRHRRVATRGRTERPGRPCPTPTGVAVATCRREGWEIRDPRPAAGRWARTRAEVGGEGARATPGGHPQVGAGWPSRTASRPPPARTRVRWRRGEVRAGSPRSAASGRPVPSWDPRSRSSASTFRFGVVPGSVRPSGGQPHETIPVQWAKDTINSAYEDRKLPTSLVVRIRPGRGTARAEPEGPDTSGPARRHETAGRSVFATYGCNHRANSPILNHDGRRIPSIR